MRKKILYENKSLYRDSFKVHGFVFGGGEDAKKSVCIMGNLRGNEYQQLYTCSRIVQALKGFEERGAIRSGHEILVVPSANPYSMNIGKRFWPIDDTDINRMFPGYAEGETTQRIAGGIFEQINDYEYGIQLVSNYLPGRFMPCISVMKTELGDYTDLAREFGMPYVIRRNPRPYDTTTLNYNWQIWETKAFALYLTETDTIDKQAAVRGVKAVLSFLNAIGVVDYKGHAGYRSQVVDDGDMVSVRTKYAGLFEPAVSVEQEVIAGQLLASVLDPLDGEVLEHIYTPSDGVVFFVHDDPMTYAHAAVIKLIAWE